MTVTSSNKKTSFKTTRVENFTNAHALEVQANVHEVCGPLVSLDQYAGAMHFRFSMTPGEAVSMAARLLEAADSLEENAVLRHEDYSIKNFLGKRGL